MRIIISQVVEQGAPKTCIPILLPYISKIANVCAPLLHSWESQSYVFAEFLVGNSIILINFCLKQFLIQLELLATFSPNANLLSHNSTLLLFIYLKTPNVWQPLAPLLRKIEDVRLLSFL